MRQEHNKLIRDKLLSAIADSGCQYEIEILSKTEYLKALKKKLVEEADEVTTAVSHPEIIEELADLQEVIDTLLSVLNISQDEIFRKQKLKREEKGGFEGKICLKWLDK